MRIRPYKLEDSDRYEPIGGFTLEIEVKKFDHSWGSGQIGSNDYLSEKEKSGL